jgi:hypothetical protein
VDLVKTGDRAQFLMAARLKSWHSFTPIPAFLQAVFHALSKGLILSVSLLLMNRHSNTLFASLHQPAFH